MRIGIAAPIDLGLLRDLLPSGVEIPQTYSFPLTASLAREFHRRGHEVVLFVLSREVTHTRRVDGERITVYICPQRLPRWQMFDFFRGERHALRDAMRISGCDVIHAHWTYEFGSAAIESGLPHVITAHDTPVTVLRFARHPYWFEKPWLAVRVLRKARCVTAVSPYLARELERFFRPQKDIVIVPNGVEQEVFAMGSRRSAIRNGKSVVFASVLNGWDPRKNGKALIKAFALVREKFGERAELRMIGTGFEPGGPADLWARRHGAAAGVRFVGSCPHPEVLKILAEDVDVLVHPAVEETFCMAALEAMAIGVPVIGGTEAGAIPWLLDGGQCGVLADVTSARSLAESMTGFIQDRFFATQLAPRARHFAQERFTIAGVVDCYERLCQLQTQ